MTPFPETEIMTIKRLEVALRKTDFKLLKDGAYKLHEKYHSGHIFEYIDLLKDLYEDIMNNNVIPVDIKNILIPTMEDILVSQGVSLDGQNNNANINTQAVNSNVQNQKMPERNRVSSLTSLSYVGSIEKDAPDEETLMSSEKSVDEKLSAFEAFGTPDIAKTIKKPNIEPEQLEQSLAQSAIPLKQEEEVQSASVENEYIEQNRPQVQMQNNAQNQFTNQYQQQNQYIDNPADNIKIEPITFNQNIQPISNEPLRQNPTEVPAMQYRRYSEPKSIAIFFGQDFSDEKSRNILKYKELVFNSDQNKVSMMDILKLICEINIQANTNVISLKNIFEQLKIRQNKVNLITNSQSAALISLLTMSGMRYSIYNPASDTKINLVPMYGLTNLFRCVQCKSEYLDTQEFHTPLVVECSKCKSPMFPDFYAPDNARPQINLNYYNSSTIAFANSRIWLLICPPLDDKICVNMLRSALKMSSQVEEIFILDKDINVRETYKNIFFDINNSVKIHTQVNVIEEFFNSIN